MVWDDDALMLLDQRELPAREVWLRLKSWQAVAVAIRDMAVRGAPAIGIAAGYGLALAALHRVSLAEAKAGLAASRPTAVNLFWALDRISKLPSFDFGSVLAEARAIEKEDLACNLKIGENGASLLENGSRILTICNTGSLATGGHGTALGIIRTAFMQNKVAHVFACETRPRWQGLKLTAWELSRERIPYSVIADGAAASLMRAGRVDAVVAGADRIAANGDTANKIGTYMLAVCAEYHRVPFYIAAPSSTFDSSLLNGDGIEIENRSAAEMTHVGELSLAVKGVVIENPGFDVTPGALITAIVTESGIFRRPYEFRSRHD